MTRIVIPAAGQAKALVNPYTLKLVADLARADAALLHRRAWGRSVLEIGAGGSTVLLAQCAEELVSIETDPKWIELAAAAVQKETANRCSVTFHQVASPEALGDADWTLADLVFIDGRNDQRAAWVKLAIEQRFAPELLIHDSRRDHILPMFKFLFDHPWSNHVDGIKLHAENSNMLWVTLRARPVVHENWNRAETWNRSKHLHLRK